MTFEVWTEKYRPKRLDEVKGQNEIVDTLKSFVKSGNMPHLLFAGMQGTGKTTCFLALAREFYGENWKDNVLELNASDDRGISIVRNEIKDFARTKPIGDVPFKLIFLDEADALTKEAQQALRRTMEDYTKTVRFCLSCNYSSRIIAPIQSRCAIFRFRPLPEGAVIEVLRDIVSKENFQLHDENSSDMGVLRFIYSVSEGDCRKAKNILQAAVSTSKFKLSNTDTAIVNIESIAAVVSFAEPKELETAIAAALSGNFNAAKNAMSQVLLKYGLSGLDAIKQIQKQLWDMDSIDEKLKVQLIRTCGEHEFRLVEGANEFVQLNSLLAEFTLLGSTNGK